jgi:23S rRNA pseudouridine2605 synthase
VNNLDRISKVIARRTGASRREAERLIQAFRVKINDQLVTNLAEKVSYQEQIYIDDLPIAGIQKAKIWLFYKPIKTLCSTKDNEGRQLIYDFLPDKYKNLKYIGRLDYMSEGLLLLTNDGEVARYFTLPVNNIERHYEVKIFGRFDEEDLRRRFKRKIIIDGESFFIKDFSVISKGGANSWISLVLTEGKNREIRKIMDKFGLRVTKLVRTAYGPYHIGNLKAGNIREVELKDFKIGSE